MMLMSVQVASADDISVTKVPTATTVNAGDPIGWVVTITARNDGLDLAASANVQLRDLLPEAIITDSIQIAYRGNPLSCNIGTPGNPADPLRCNLGFMDQPIIGGPEVTVITITGRVKPDYPSGPIINDAEVTASTGNFNLTNDRAYATVNVVANPAALPADLKALKFGKPDAGIRQNEPITYTLIGLNLGPGVAPSLIMTDIIAADGAYRMALPAGCSAVPAAVAGLFSGNTTVTCNVTGPISMGQQSQVTLVLTPTTATSVNDTLWVSSRNSDPNPDNNFATVMRDIARAADLHLRHVFTFENQIVGQHGLIVDSNAASPLPQAPNYATMDGNVTAGRRSLHRINVGNLGPSTADNVKVEILLPYGSTLLEQTLITDGAFNDRCYTESAGALRSKIICQYSNLQPGLDRYIQFQLLYAANLPPGLQLSLDAVVYSDYFDNSLASNSVNYQFDVNAWADLTISKRSVGQVVTGYDSAGRPIIEDRPNEVTAGLLLRYPISVTNNGPSLARNVIVRDSFLTVPPVADGWLIFERAEGAACSPSAINQKLLFCDLGPLEAGDRRGFDLFYRVDPAISVSTAISNCAVALARNHPQAGQSPMLPLTNDPFLDDNQACSPVIVNTSLALTLTKTASKLNPINGEVFYYTLVVTNTGVSLASDIILSDTLPAGVVFVSADDATCSLVGGVVRCAPFSLLPGASRVVRIYVMARADVCVREALVNVAEAAISNGDGGYRARAFARNAGVVIDCVADLAIRKIGKPDKTIFEGETITYTIIVNNLGPGVAVSATITDLVASDGAFTVQSITPIVSTGAPVCNPLSPALPANSGAAGLLDPPLTCGLGNMAPGARYEYVVYVTSRGARSINNLAEVHSLSRDPNTANNFAMVEHEVIARADLAISKAASPSPAIAGDLLTYTVRITNTGPSTATNVVVNDLLPLGTPGVSLLSLTPSRGSCTAVAFVCTLGTMSGLSGTALITAVVKVHPDVVSGTVLINNASVRSDTLDDNNANNSSHVLTPVQADVRLWVVKTDRPDPVVAGTQLDYQIEITNVGRSTGFNINLKDDLPSAVSYIGHEVIYGNISCLKSPFSLELECVIDKIAPGETVKILIHTKVSPDAGGIITNTILANPLYVPTSTLTATTQITCLVDLAITQTVNKVSANDGELVIFTVRATNSGPSTARDVKITDKIDKELVIVAINNASTIEVQPQGRLKADRAAYVPKCDWSAESGLITCDVGNMRPGEEVAFQVVAMVVRNNCISPKFNMPHPITAVAYISNSKPETRYDNNTASASLLRNCHTDMRITKIAKPDDKAVPGQDIEYTIIVENLGPNGIAYAHMVDEFIANGKFTVKRIVPDVTNEYPSANCSPAAPFTVNHRATIVCRTDAPIPMGRRWLIQMVVVAEQEMDINNVATINIPADDLNPGNNITVVERGVTCGANGPFDLALRGKAGVTSVRRNASLVYDMDYMNLGAFEAACVGVAAQIPAGTTFDKAASSAEWECANGGQEGAICRLNVGRLSGLGQGKARFVVTTNATTPSQRFIANTFKIQAGDTLEDNMNNNIAALSVALEADGVRSIGDKALPHQVYLPMLRR